MRQFGVFLLLTFWSFQLIAQTDNYSFLKLMVVNKDEKVMLVKWDGAWEVPGIRYNHPVTLTQMLGTLAAEHGITIGRKKLQGIFTFAYESRSTITLMQYYKAKFDSGTLTVPASCEDIGWFTMQEALSIIPYPDMKMILSKIDTNPDNVWGAAIKKYNDGSVEVVEDFYKWQ